MLFQRWSGQPHRPTRDLDLLGKVILTRTDSRNSSATFPSKRWKMMDWSFTLSRSRRTNEEGKKYQGLDEASRHTRNDRIPIQIDIGFGDNVYPRRRDRLSDMFDLPAPT